MHKVQGQNAVATITSHTSPSGSHHRHDDRARSPAGVGRRDYVVTVKGLVSAPTMTTSRRESGAARLLKISQARREGLGHLVRRHGAGEQHMALQGEARHALDAVVARHAVGRGDFLEAGVAL